MNNNSCISYLSTAYLPPVDYFKVISRSEKVLIECWENYQKQSYRSRCHIYSANGLMPLIIPVLRDQNHSVRISDIRIDYTKQWQKQHWKAIMSAYKSSPFFDYYQEDLAPYYCRKEESLFEFNFKLTKTISDLIGIDTCIDKTKEYLPEYLRGDYREKIHPKKGETIFINEDGRYHQVFAHKHGFIKNLSVIDLLFNEGPNAISFL